jgi:autotransporter adhesin
MAASVVGGVSVADGKKNAVTAAVGSYGDATAIAVGVTRIMAPNKRVFGTISRASGSKTGLAAGASFSW